MSSSAKTPYLGLNKWVSSDIPQREDFVVDNVILENAISVHHQDTTHHITSAERTKWNNAYSITTYTGNGASSRAVTLNGAANPVWGIVFAAGKTPDVTDFSNTADYTYFGIVSANGSTTGLSLSGNTLTVSQSPTAVHGKEYRSYNEVSVTYVCITFA